MITDTQVLKVLIIDDEQNACINLESIINKYMPHAITVVGVANDTKDAEKQIKKLNPDAVFLDVDMPKENAFQFLNRISPFNFEVIFVTAYDQYAIKAFRLNAVDYLLKPIDIDELATAIKKLKARVSLKDKVPDSGQYYGQLLNQINSKTAYSKIRLKSINHSEVVDIQDIYFVEAQSSYSRILFSKHGETKEIIVSNPLSDYEELLPTNLYYRIHRSYLINCAYVTDLIDGDAAHFVVMKNEFRLPIGRRRILPLKLFLRSNGHLYA